MSSDVCGHWSVVSSEVCHSNEALAIPPLKCIPCSAKCFVLQFALTFQLGFNFTYLFSVIRYFIPVFPFVQSTATLPDTSMNISQINTLENTHTKCWHSCSATSVYRNWTYILIIYCLLRTNIFSYQTTLICLHMYIFNLMNNMTIHITELVVR